MKGVVFGEKISHLEDGLGFLQEISRFLNTDIDVFGFLAAEESIVKNSGLKGFLKIFYTDPGSTESIANTLSRILEEVKPDFIVGPATKNGTEILTRVSSIYSYPMVREVVGISGDVDEAKLERQIIGGRAIAVYPLKTPIAVTVPAKKFRFSVGDAEPEYEKIEHVEGVTRITDILPKEKGGVDLEAAEIIVGVGRGFKSKDDLAMAFELAKYLDGEVGCSRPIAADLKWLGEDRWIGISGKKIRGKLYFAIGISGAPQHIMAASDTRIIIAVNKDKNAPIFTYADYGVVADLYQFLPILIKKLKEKKGL